MGETEDYGEEVGLIVHATTHKSGGSDEIDISGLTPMLHAALHELGGSDEIDISGLLFKSCCHAYMTAAQNIPHVTITLVNLDTVAIDRNSDFNTSTHKFICPFDGVYLVLATLEYAQGIADKFHWCHIYKNTINVAEGVGHSSFVYRTSAHAHAIITCAQGDELTMKASQNRGTDLALYTGLTATSFLVLSLYET